MKQMVGLFVVGLVVIALITTYNLHEMTKDHGRWFVVAYGKPVSGEMPMHVALPIAIQGTDPPKLLPSGRYQDWNEWIDDHFDLTDAAGKDIKIGRIAHTKLIGEQDAGNVECYLDLRVKPGAAYTLDYIPVSTAPDKYRLEFTAPSAATDPERIQFDLQ